MKGESLFALFAGVAAGLTLGLLFAPESGKETREKVKNAAEDGLDQVKKAYGDVKDQAADAAFEMKARARLARRDLKDLKETLRDQAGDLKEEAKVKILEKLEQLEDTLRTDVGGFEDVDEQSPENA
jgi:gas vesicle protein